MKEVSARVAYGTEGLILDRIRRILLNQQLKGHPEYPGLMAGLNTATHRLELIARRLERKLPPLSELQKQALQMDLHQKLGSTYQQIADEFGVSRATVRNRLIVAKTLQYDGYDIGDT